MKAIIFKFSAILLAGLLFNFWLQFLAPFDLPESIPNTPIRIAGILLFVITILVLIYALKTLLRKDETTSISRLTLSGMSICLLAEIVFQSLRQFTFIDYSTAERILYFLMGIIGVTLFGTILSFFIAYQLKTGNTRMLIAMIAIFLAIMNMIRFLIPGFGT
jgi:hypothetical protein